MPTFLVVIAVGIIAALASPWVHPADVYRWVDENGRTHFGDAVPPRYQQKARKLGSPPGPTGVQPQEAERRVTDGMAQQAPEKNASAPIAPPADSAAAPQSAVSANETECARSKRLFMESIACFEPYRLANGGIRPEAFERCTEVKQPPQHCR